jgi:mono/diheme cytochrome c family protein
VAVAAGDPKRGEQLFAASCSMCHPQGGNVLKPGKELKGENFLKQFPKDADIVCVIRKGVPKSVMQPFPKQSVSDEQVADIVAYIRSLTPAAAKPSAGSKAAATGGHSSPVKNNHRQTQR